MLKLLEVTCLVLSLAPCGAAQNGTPPGGAAWLVRETQARVGQSRVIVMNLPAKAAKDATFAVEVKPSKALAVLAPLRVLAGHAIAYMRVQPTLAGDAHLTVRGLGGAGKLVLHVAAASHLTSAAARPHIVSPDRDARLWGDLLVGARQSGRRPTQARLLSGDKVVVRTSDYETIDGVWRLRFRLSTGELPAGPTRLLVETSYADGTRLRSLPLDVTIVHPAKDGVAVYECEELARAPRPKSVRDRRRPRVGNDRKASGGRFTLHISSSPHSLVKVHVGKRRSDKPGAAADPSDKKPAAGKQAPAEQWYQMAVVAKGSFAGGAWPTVGVILDNDTTKPRAKTPLLDEDWHRVSVGRPFRVPAGEHAIGARFLNDAYVPGILDRNLYLDRIELLPLEIKVAESVSIQLQRSALGRAVPGVFGLQGYVLRPGIKNTPPPVTRLVVNGKTMATQRSDRPRFIVGSHALVTGDNHLQLVAKLASGREVTSDKLSFQWRGKEGRFDNLLRFTASDDRFRASNPKVLRYEDGAPDGHVFRFTTNDTAALSLPDELEGAFDLSLYMRGKAFRGAAKARVTLGDKELKVLSANSSWRGHSAGRIKLTKGKKHLAVSFINDLHEQGKGDRNLSFGAFELRPVNPKRDQTGPTITLHYPKPGAKIGPVDAVVADVFDASGVRDASILIDGKPVPGVYQRLRADSRICLPFTDRRLKPGKHKLQVAATDRYGRLAKSQPIEVELVESPDASPYAGAVHFLNRLAYGPEPRLLAEVLLSSPAAVLRKALAKGPDRQALRAAERRFPNGASSYHVSRRVVDMARRNDNPIRTRLLLFWENHFTTWIRKVGAEAEWAEHLRLQEVANRDFGQLLRTSAHSPAMMRYLDNTRSFAGKINENYAREIMELHTLGVTGGYTQKDVEALSRVLTGWSATSDSGQLEFAFLAGVHDRSTQSVIGYRVPGVAREASGAKAWELSRDRGETMLEVLLAHPSTARFVASKLVAHYVAHPSPKDAVDAIAKTYLETGGDVSAMLMSILESKAFAAATPGSKGTDPFEFALRLSRLGRWDHPWDMATLLDAVQRLPMERSTPDGYPEDAAAWFDSSSTLQRWRFVERAAGSIRWQLFHGPARSSRAITKPHWNQGLIDWLAVHLFGRRLSDQSNATALKVLAEAKRDVNTRVGLAISILGQLPEAHMH